jgi:glutathione S-transferase
MLTLCGFSVSNYYNKVKLALLEKGIPFTEELVMTGSTDDAVLAATPLAKVPFLRTPGATCAKARPWWTTWRRPTPARPCCRPTRWPPPRCAS